MGGPPGPPRGQRRRPWRAVDLASLDFEATGLNFERDRIISLGVVPIEGGRIDIGRAVYELVDPGDVALTGETITIHGLRPIDVQGASSAEAARETLRRALAGRFLITWYATVEASFLAKLFGTRPTRWLRRSIDVRRLVVGLLGAEAAGLTLEQAAARFDVPVASPHHALDDALVTAQLFLVAASKLGTMGAGTPGDLMRVGNPPYRR